MSDPNDLAAFLTAAWQHLSRGVTDNRSPARHPTFATVSPEGLPEARTVALRRASQAQAIVEVHTDIVTPKVQALRARPQTDNIHRDCDRSDVRRRMGGSPSQLACVLWDCAGPRNADQPCLCL